MSSGRRNVIKREQAEALMDIYKMLAELRGEREQVEEAILTLERLARSRGHRRGRPPSWLKEVDSHLNIGQAQQSNGGVRIDERKVRGRPPGSKKQSAQPFKVGLYITETLTEGEPISEDSRRPAAAVNSVGVKT